MAEPSKRGLGIPEIIGDKRAQVLEIARRRGAYNVRIFGSVARGDAHSDSDVDFLVEFPPKYRLLDHAGLLADLEDLLGRRVRRLGGEEPSRGVPPIHHEGCGAIVKDRRLYLADILKRIGMIESFTESGRKEFFASQITQESTIRCLEIIGEIIKRLSPEVTNPHPEVPWHDLARMRDVLIHQYDRISLETVWDTVQNDLPPLKTAVQALLDSLPEDEAAEE